MDDKTTTAISLSSDHPLDVGKFMVVRCKGGKSELLINLDGMVQAEGGGTAVRYRLDDGMPVSEEWSESTDYHAIFAPYPERLAKRLVTAKRFRLEYQEFHGGHATVGFRTGRLSEALPQVASACHWDIADAKAQAAVAAQERDAERLRGMRFVGDRGDHRYTPSSCSVARAVPSAARIYFSSEKDAVKSGYTRMPFGCEWGAVDKLPAPKIVEPKDP